MDWESVSELEEGEELFHGTSVADPFRIPAGPAWFSDSPLVAEYFTTWRSGPAPRVLRFEITDGGARLAVFDSRRDFELFADQLGMDAPEDPQELADMVCRAGFDGWIVPENYPEGADVMLCDPGRWLRFLEESELPPAREPRRRRAR